MSLLCAAPLSAQQTVVVPNVDVTVNGDTIVVNVVVMSDSVRLARIADAVESLAQAIAECGCMEQQGQANTVVRYGVPAVAVLLGFLGLRKLTQIVDAINNHDHPQEEEEEEEEPQYGESG